jgi:hypothetical protein
MPNPPAFQRRKRPGDVYHRIHAAIGLLRELAGRAGLTMLDPGASPLPVDEVLPSDCYDLASLLISELVYVHARVRGLPPPAGAEMYEVGHKLPSHCDQRAAQVEAGLRAIASKPDLLR